MKLYLFAKTILCGHLENSKNSNFALKVQSNFHHFEVKYGGKLNICKHLEQINLNKIRSMPIHKKIFNIRIEMLINRLYHKKQECSRQKNRASLMESNMTSKHHFVDRTFHPSFPQNAH